MNQLFKNTFRYISLHMLKYIPWIRGIYEVLAPYKLCYAPDFLKAQEMCNEAVRYKPWSLNDVPDCFKTQEMCDAMVREGPFTLWYVPNHLKTQEVCNKAVHTSPLSLEYVPDHFKTQRMCNEMHNETKWSAYLFFPIKMIYTCLLTTFTI